MELHDIAGLESALGVTFQNKEHLQQALVHRSFLNENPEFSLSHNERLEFLGDAVLELVVTEHLYNNYPNPEGELTNWRAALVNANMLSEIAKGLTIEDYLYLSRGEAKDRESKARHYILANAIEAVIGAMYLDQGYAVAAEFIGRAVIAKLPYILEHKLYMDPKSKLQEIAQEKLGVTPQYKTLEEKGPDHNKWFTVGVFLGEESAGQGEGSSKQEAQVAAAVNAMENKGW